MSGKVYVCRVPYMDLKDQLEQYSQTVLSWPCLQPVPQRVFTFLDCSVPSSFQTRGWNCAKFPCLPQPCGILGNKGLVQCCKVNYHPGVRNIPQRPIVWSSWHRETQWAGSGRLKNCIRTDTISNRIACTDLKSTLRMSKYHLHFVLYQRDMHASSTGVTFCISTSCRAQ